MDAIGREQVMRQFKQLYTEQNPYFAVFESAGKKDQKRTWRESDIDGGTAFLEAYLKDLEVMNDTSALCIRFYDELDKGKITPKSEWVQSLQFRMKEASYGPSAAPTGGQASDFTNFLMMQWQQEKETREELQEELTELHEEIKALQETPAPGADMGFIGQIGAVGQQYPWMQDIMKDLVFMVKRVFSKPDAQQAAHIAGIMDKTLQPDTRMNNALKILIGYFAKKAGDQQKGFIMLTENLEMLAEMTENPLDFDYAVAKLRENFAKQQPA